VDGGDACDDAVYDASTLGGEFPNQRRRDFGTMDRLRDEGGSIGCGKGHGRRNATGWQRPLSDDGGILDSLQLSNASMLRDERQGRQRAYHETLQRQIDANTARETEERNAQQQREHLEDQNSIGYNPWGRPGGGAPTAKYTHLYEARSKSESPKKSRTDKGVMADEEKEGPETPWLHSDEQVVRRRRDAAFRDGLDQQTNERRLLKAQRKQADDEKERKMEAKVRRELLEAGKHLHAPIADVNHPILVDNDNRRHVPGSDDDRHRNKNPAVSSGRRLNMPVFKIVQNTSYERDNEVAYESGVNEEDLSARSMTDTFYKFKEGLEKAITLRREMSRGRWRRQRSTLY
jgi:hypothetical protein